MCSGQPIYFPLRVHVSSRDNRQFFPPNTLERGKGQIKTRDLLWQVSGVVDGVYALGGGGEHRARVLAEAEAAAKAQAVAAGAHPDTCQVRPYQKS